MSKRNLNNIKVFYNDPVTRKDRSKSFTPDLTAKAILFARGFEKAEILYPNMDIVSYEDGEVTHSEFHQDQVDKDRWALKRFNRTGKF